MSNDTILDLDNILDGNLAQTEDVPDYVNPPAGLYQLKLLDAKLEKFTLKKKAGVRDSDQQSARIKFQYEIVEVLDTKELPPAAGSLFSESFMANEDGLKYFKKQAKAILNVADFGDTSIRDILDGLKDAEFKAAISIRKSGEFENTVVRPMHDTPAA